jgi:predicted dehydrogenase
MSTPSGKTLRFGVIGFGNRGTLSLNAHSPDAGNVVVAVADPGGVRREKAEQRIPGVKTYVDYREMLKRDDIDAVFVLSPDWLHEEHALAALEAGKAVYLEKPMAITIDGCDKLLRMAHKTKAKLYVGHNMRHSNKILKMKELIDSGVIGEVQTAWQRHFINYGGDAYYKDWHADRTKSTGLLLQKAAHDLDVLHWLCGGHSVRVNAMGKLSVYNRVTDRLDLEDPYAPRDINWRPENWPPLAVKDLYPIIDVEDLSMLHAEFNNGVLVAYQQCHYTPDHARNVTVIGTHGRIENLVDEKGDNFIALWNKRARHSPPTGDEQFHLENKEGGHGGADPAIVGEFIRYVRDDAPISITPLEARHAVAATYTATMSIRNGGQVMDVPPPPVL